MSRRVQSRHEPCPECGHRHSLTVACGPRKRSSRSLGAEDAANTRAERGDPLYPWLEKDVELDRVHEELIAMGLDPDLGDDPPEDWYERRERGGL